MIKRGIKYTSVLLMLSALIMLTQCTKDGDSDNDGGDDIVGTPVMILGEVDMAVTQAVKVLALSSTESYKTADITGNHFKIQLDNGKPWGLIFLNSANQPLGLLSPGNGIETLPLHYTKAGIDSIDLQTITRSGNIFTPSHNPLDNEIPLSPQQLEVVAGMDDYLAATLKNPDVNGNGQIDLLEGKFFKLSVIYFIHPGRFNPGNLTPTLNTNSVVGGFRLFLTVRDGNYPETVYFTGPAGSRVYSTPSESYLSFTSHRVYSTPYIYDDTGMTNMIPPGGTYTIKYGDQTLTFNLNDQSYVAGNIVYPYPTLTLNSGGTLNKIDWSYQYSAGTVGFDLSALMRNIQIQIEGNGNKCSDHQNSDRLYDSGRLPVNTVSHSFSCQNIDWGIGTPFPDWKHIDRVMMTYEDHYDAIYVVMYERNY